MTDMEWIVGVSGVAISLALLGLAVIKRDRDTRQIIDDQVRDVRTEASAERQRLREVHDRDMASLRATVDVQAKELHERISRAREEMLRKGELAGPIKHLETLVGQMRDEMRIESKDLRKTVAGMDQKLTEMRVAFAEERSRPGAQS